MNAFTGLVWQDSSVVKTTTRTWNDAVSYCSGLGNGWRLPNIYELVSLINQNGNNPAIFTDFTNTASSHYWSSSRAITNNSDIWGVGFKEGLDGLGYSYAIRYYTRCVQGETYSNTQALIRDDEKEVVLDRQNNLMWEDTVVPKSIQLTWQEAINYCEALTLGGYSDWRVPNYKELYYLSDKSKVSSFTTLYHSIQSNSIKLIR